MATDEGRAAPRPPLLPLEHRRQLYAARRYIDREVEDRIDLTFEVDVHFKDPHVARSNPAIGIDTNFRVPWEPGLGDGPTSARFVVVDYDGTTRSLAPPARWDAKFNLFRDPDGTVVDAASADTPWFRQVSTWAIIQRTLDEFEGPFGLGRRISWGFQGNRLIVVPHAGYGENAFYDRTSKSLQFYYFDDEDGTRIYTCLSSDIVNHELGHAILDGIRPHYLEAVTPETAAFHEFLGDFTAIVMAFRNNSFRREIGRRTDGDLRGESLVSGIAQEFGRAVGDQEFLRSAENTLTMADVADSLSPHRVSQVMTGAIFDFLLSVSASYRDRADGERPSVANALWWTVQRVQRMAVQALDFLPPVELTFRDYAEAMLRAEEIADPVDPSGYRRLLVEIFEKRGILGPDDRARWLAREQVLTRVPLDLVHDVEGIVSSRADAYRFLDDNRRSLFIPYRVDIESIEVDTARKLGRQALRLPRQAILQYVWREEVLLEGERFGPYRGRRTAIPCGGTIVFDDGGNILHWVRRPGAEPLLGRGADDRAEETAGMARREAYLSMLARRIEAGMVGSAVVSPVGMLGESLPLLSARAVDGAVRFELTPHVSCRHQDGCGSWQMSS